MKMKLLMTLILALLPMVVYSAESSTLKTPKEITQAAMSRGATQVSIACGRHSHRSGRGGGSFCPPVAQSAPLNSDGRTSARWCAPGPFVEFNRLTNNNLCG